MKWARWLEAAVGVWLAAAWRALPIEAGPAPASLVPLAAGALVIALAAASGRWPRRRLHLLNLSIAAGMIALAFAGWPDPPSAGAQNSLLCGVLLLVLGVLPTLILEPPAGWRDRYADGARRPAE